MNVLILDDNQSSLNKTCNAIRGISQINIISKTEAADLIDCLNSNSIDIVVTDSQVGEVGIDSIISKCTTYNHLSIIVLSSRLSEDEVTSLMLSGITEYVSKNQLNRLQHVLQKTYAQLTTRRNLDATINQLHNVVKSKSALIENIPGVVYRCTHKNNWKPDFMSDQCEIVTGYPFSYFQEHGYEPIVHPQDLPEVHRLIDTAVAEKKQFELHYRIFTRDGQIRFMWERGNAIFDYDGNVEALEGIIMDVTSNKVHELLIQQFNKTVNIEAGGKYFSKLTEFLYENLDCKVVMIGRYIEQEQAIQSISFRVGGKEQNDIIYNLVGTPCETVLSKKKCIYNKDVQMLFPDDKDLVALNATSYIGVPALNSDEKLLGLIVLIDDKPMVNTETKELILSLIASRVGNELEHLCARHKITESEAKLRAVIENQTEMIIRWNISGKIIFANERFLNYRALKEEDLHKTNYLDLIHDKERFKQKIEKINIHSREVKDIHQSTGPEGKTVWHEWTDVASFDEFGQIHEIQSTGRDITKQREAELSIYREKEKLRKYLETTPTIVLILDAAGNIEMINSIGCEILEYRIGEILTKNWFDYFTSPIDNERLKNIYVHNLLNGIAPQHNRENWIKSKSGKEILISWYNSPIRDKVGKITGVMSIGIDITEKRKSQNQIAENESLLRNAQRLTHTGSFVVTPGNPLRTWSDEMYTIFEVDRETFIPTFESIIPFVFEEDQDQFIKMTEPMMSGKNLNYVEYKLKTRNGNVKYMQAFGESVFDDEGKVIKIIGTAQDITQLKLAELKIKEKEIFGEGILTAIHDSIVVVDDAGKIIKSNQQWKKFAISNSGVLSKLDQGVNYLDVCRKSIQTGDEYARLALDGIMSILNLEKKIFEMEYPCHSENERRWFSMKVTPFGGGFGGAVIMHTDISSKRKKDEELQASINEIYVTEEINKALLENKSTAELSFSILEGLNMLLGNTRSRLYQYNSETHTLTILAEKVSQAMKARVEKKTGTALSTIIPDLIKGSMFDDVISNRKTIISNDKNSIRQLLADHTSNTILKKLATWALGLFDIKSFGLIPLTDRDNVIGLLTFSTPVKLTEHEKLLIDRFANHASTILGKKFDELKLSASEEKFKAISNYTANWETWIAPTGLPIWINPGVLKLSGYRAEELLALSNYYEFVIHKEDLPYVMKILQKALDERAEGENLEFRINHKNGTKPWFSVSWKQVYDANGNWLGIRVSGLEITQRKLYESEILDKQNELQETQKIASLGGWFWNTETECIRLNENLTALLGFKESSVELTIKQLDSLIHTESKARIQEAIFNARHDFKSTEIEVRLNLPNGTEKYLLIRTNLVSPDYSFQPAVKGTALDITEIKTSHNKTKEIQEKFQKIFDSIQDVYYQTDLFRNITLVSPSVINMLGYTPEELIGKPISILFAKSQINELKIAKQHLLDKTEYFETVLLAKNNTEINVSVKLNYLVNDNGEIYAIQGMLRNITEKKKQELSLENQRTRLLEIVKLNSQIIQTSDHFYYVIEKKETGYQLNYVSSQISEVLGITEMQLLRSVDLWNNIIHEEDLLLHEEAMEKVQSEKKPQRISYRVNHQLTSKTIWIDDYICPLLNSEGNVTEIYGSAKDSTERVTALLNLEAEKKQTMAYQYQLLSSQLNPHFIYNTLNSFQYYILQGQVESSLNHISDFSKLMRKVLENSMYEYISIEDEINFLEQYIRISNQRMKTTLEFDITTHDDFDPTDLMIPPMLLQPYVENSIVHGFTNFTDVAKISVYFESDDERVLCSITDNGIGRKQSQVLKGLSGQPGRKSFAMGINESRISLLNQITNGDFKVDITDLYDEKGLASGTKVEITYKVFNAEQTT